MKKIVINGIALSNLNNISGIPRFCRELILRLDRLFGSDFVVEYLYMEDAENLILGLNELKNIIPVEVKKSKRFMALNLKVIPKYLKSNDAICVNFAPEAVNTKEQILTIHDLRPALFKGGDSFKTKLKYKINLNLAKKKSLKILTVSNYQKELIKDYLKLNDSQVCVIYNGWEHLNNIETDETIFERNLQIKKGEYFYTIGSLAPHKNFKWILEVAKRNENKQFIIAGGKNLKVWKDNIETNEIKNVHFIGYVTDEENKALLSNCKAFLFPSKYEGFGLPPLEALACGVPIIISNATCLPEIYENSAHYINPDDYEVDLDKLLNEPVAPAEKILQKCSWDVVSMQIYDIIKAEAKN